MSEDTLAAALEREHREIDEGIEAFTAGRAGGTADPGPLTRAMDALRRHIYLEEEFVFPPLRAAGMMPPVLVMLREHGEIWKTMDELEAALEKDAAGDDVLALCTELTPRLQAHNEKEEPIIYPQADAVLSEETAGRLREFLASGVMPEGWVCQRAAA
jgi:regulator of cell morphogenesis and NO signaling